MADQPRARDGSVSLSEVTGTLSNRGYNLIRKLGEGTYAKVYMASYVPQADPSKKIFLACKVVDTTKAPRDFVKRFLPRELDILKKLNHPHIVHVHSIFQRRSKYFIFMRLAENGDLLDWVLKFGAVKEAQSRVWLRQLSMALQYLQALDIAHRDLKCENVLITANYNVKLADFGFARYCTDARGRRVLSGTNCGSLSYAAPEILRGEHYDPRISDIWSLGVVLYIMLNKAMPFDDTNINRLHDEQIHRRWRFCASVVDALTDQVKTLIYNMLEPDVQRRFTVDHILRSDWIAMDDRLTTSTSAEEAALEAARTEREARLRTEGDTTAPPLLPAPAGPGAPSELGATAYEVESVRYWEDSTETKNILQEAKTEATLPRTPEEIDIIAQRQAAEANLCAQTFHGRISEMDSQVIPATQPQIFLPPDLSEKLMSQTSNRMSDRTLSIDKVQDTEQPEEKDIAPEFQNNIDESSEDRAENNDTGALKIEPSVIGQKPFISELESTVPELKQCVSKIEQIVPQVEQSDAELHTNNSEIEKNDHALYQSVPELEQSDPELRHRVPELEQTDPEQHESIPQLESSILEVESSVASNKNQEENIT